MAAVAVRSLARKPAQMEFGLAVALSREDRCWMARELALRVEKSHQPEMVLAQNQEGRLVRKAVLVGAIAAVGLLVLGCEPVPPLEYWLANPK